MPTERSRAQGRDTKRILIVDDEPSFTSLLKILLEKNGPYEVVVENRAGAVFEAVEAFKPDLIFLDIIMPDGEGRQIADELGASPKTRRIPVVFLTAMISRDQATVFSEVEDGRPYLAKPVTIEEVLRVVEGVFAKKS